jgi:predicted RNA binding protein YcfA (HicA-like mRNA interferase family)
MPKLPRAKGADVIAALERAGFSLSRIRGSHHHMRKDGHPNLVSVPVHGSHPLKLGTLKGLIKSAGLTVKEFLALLK